jgi:hypothetical protein
MQQTLSTRRSLLQKTACGFGHLALAGLAGQNSRVRAGVDNPLTVRSPMVPARAKRIIFLFMHGAPSQVDSFDYKPELQRRGGKTVTLKNPRFGQVEDRKLLGSPWRFRQHGQSGAWVSSLFPEVAKHVDDICFIRSLHTTGTAHGQATLFMHTGSTNLVRPAMGSWICYGLGSESENLPGFVTICPSANIGGTRVYSSAFLPSAFQGTALGQAERPVTEATFQNVQRTDLPPLQRERQLNLLRRLNEQQLAGVAEADSLEATVNSFEMAYRMQKFAPQITDIGRESLATQAMYGVGQKETDDYGRQCLLARRLSEAGVRYVQVNFTDNTTTPKWDQHSNLKTDHETHAQAVDRPIAALLKDLKQRGLLDDTLVWWGGEFGRTPYSENDTGRDHNPLGFTMWLAGGGVKPGFSYGETDELDVDPPIGVAWNRGFVADFPEFTVSQLRQGGLSCQARQPRLSSRNVSRTFC